MRPAANRQLLIKLAVVAAGMFGFGFALVPFYKAICEAAGINNLLQPDEVAANGQIDRSRTVTIEFDANTHDVPWRFKPRQASLTVHPGELAHVVYEVQNTRPIATTGQAIPSYGPRSAAQYFRKLECFCFTQQALQAGETRAMPVAFVVDPALPADVNTITLSYTFFEVAGTAAASKPEPAADASAGGRS